jgi:soluble lytic murein transglycosylase-like protein
MFVPARTLADRARYNSAAIALAALAVLSLGLGVAAASAQVLEIGDGGRITVYDEPAVVTGAGVTPIHRSSVRILGDAFSQSPALAPLVDAALATQISPALVEAVAWQESRLRPGVRSRAGAIGEMQLMPRTARALGVNPYDSRQNYVGGATYLGGLLQRYDGDIVLALAAYNAGPGAVSRWGGVPPYKETRDYVAAILDRLSQRATLSAAPNSER